MSLLNLPTELYDQIFSYLDWDRSKDLEPKKDDIVNASLTCQHLRKVLIPFVFRDVTLRLRWVNESLSEPLLFVLRRERPDLARHVRCVFIRTEFEMCLHCAQKDDPPVFLAPEGIKDWLYPSGIPRDLQSEREKADRSRVDMLAQEILNPTFSLSAKEPSESAEEAILSYYRRNGRNSDLDALTIAMLCIPSSTNQIIFKSLTSDYRSESKNNFAIRLFATALDIHRHRVQDVTMISNTAAGRLTMSRRALARLGTGGAETDAISKEVLHDLITRRLVMAVNDLSTFRSAPSISVMSYQRWHHMSHCLRELELRCINTNTSDLSEFIKGFTHLEIVRIQDCVLGFAQQPMAHARIQELQASIWLTLAIELRRALQHVQIELSGLHRRYGHHPLPACATEWIASQAIPTGSLIDVDREERLLVDYASFSELLWEAETDGRGAQALSAWETQRAKLSDEAMSRRWS